MAGDKEGKGEVTRKERVSVLLFRLGRLACPSLAR